METVQSRTATPCLIMLLMATGLAAAENPFVGTWNLNPAKSKFTGDTMTFERSSSGEIHWSGAGLAYTFKIDGKEYPGPVGDLVVWKQVDDHNLGNYRQVEGNSYQYGYLKAFTGRQDHDNDQQRDQAERRAFREHECL